MYKYQKGIIDKTIAVAALIILLPMFIIICLFIRMDSKGLIFFVQKRVGKDGVIFNMYKFRSMKSNTPNVASDQLQDSTLYVTPIGRILRKTSLDELPQLLNIIKGDMSLIGPRPALYNQYELIGSRRRLGIERLNPGITGYAQIMGRDNITEEQKIAYDKYYLDHLSFALDILIVYKTVIKIVRAEDIRS